MPRFEQIDAPARIGIVGDTHRSSRNPRPLPKVLLDGLAGVDLIFHTGDVNAPWVLEALREIAPVRAVRGNNEEPPLDETLPERLYFQIGEHRVGLMHGHGSTRREPGRVFAENAMRGHVDCVVYGHSHKPVIEQKDGLLMINPGSPTQRRFAPSHTYAMMTVNTRIHAELIRID